MHTFKSVVRKVGSMHEYLRTRKAIGCMIVIVACFVVVVFLEVELNEIVFFCSYQTRY